MEKYYVVLMHKTATSRNEWQGRSRTYVYGKAKKCLYSYGDPTGQNNFDYMVPYWVREYGYKRKCDAERSCMHTHPEADCPMWKTDSWVVAVWVKKDGHVSYVP